jgi:chloride channel 2
MLAASVAAGVTSTFNAPIGGVIFSIEVTSTYYAVNDLWKAFFWAGCTIITLKFLNIFHKTSIFQPTKLLDLAFDYQYIGYIVLAMLWGVIGSLFITIINNLIFIRAKFRLPIFSNRWIICTIVALFVSLCSFPFDFMRVPEKNILNEMFSQKPLAEQEKVYWSHPSIMINLVLFFWFKFFVIVMWVSLPIPSGVFTPSLLLGAVFGRFFGYILRLTLGPHIHETTYAIVGATCMTASVTRTLSVAMIVFEIHGELTYLVPVLIGTIISYAISNSIGRSIFDILLDMKDLPYLPTIRAENMTLKAEEIMKTGFDYLEIDSPLSDLNGLLGDKQRVIPVVKWNGLLVWAVDVQWLRKYLIKKYESECHKFSAEVRETLNVYFHYIKSVNSHTDNEFYIRNNKSDHNSKTRREQILGHHRHHKHQLHHYKPPSNKESDMFQIEKPNQSPTESFDADDSSDERLKEFWKTPIGMQIQ